jgi:hypothetical protein
MDQTRGQMSEGYFDGLTGKLRGLLASEAGRDIWEVVDTESETSEGTTVLNVVYDD